MHVDIDYSGLEEPAKMAKALADIKDYLGWERMSQCERIFKEEASDMTIDAFAMNCSMFIGIEGYPVKAWYNKIYGL